jgi:phosphoenolpyruvate carboxykinase (ATP)
MSSFSLRQHEITVNEIHRNLPPTGKRIKLANTRAIIDAIHRGALAKAATEPDPVFGLDVVTKCLNVPSEILIPRNVWSDKASLQRESEEARRHLHQELCGLWGGVSAEVKAVGPVA